MAELSPYMGSIDGIRIQLHWSFILLLLLILFLSAYYFLIWIFLFICVLIHEMTHSITSRRNGIAVKKIILYPFGGGSVIDFEKVSPEAEFRISIVGPIASLLLAAVFGILAIYSPAGIVRYTVQTLFELNVFLGVFNILPWLPLDGGRALRSYLQEKRSYFDATRIAVQISNAVTALFILGTFVYVLLIPGTFLYKEFVVLWDITLGLFIYGGAKSELQNAYVKDNVSELRAGDAMSKNYVEVNRSMTIPQLYRTMLKHRTNVILYREGSIVKAVSDLTLDKMPWKGKALKDVMPLGKEIPQIQYNAQLFSAIDRMRTEETGMVAVMKGRQLAGVLLAQHVESVIALYLSHKRAMRKD